MQVEESGTELKCSGFLNGLLSDREVYVDTHDTEIGLILEDGQCYANIRMTHEEYRELVAKMQEVADRLPKR